MKKILPMMFGATVFLVTPLVIAAEDAMPADTTTPPTVTTPATTTTTMPTTSIVNWICTTNASTATTPEDSDADNKMARKDKYANDITTQADAFKFASDHCRDCTKISCELVETTR